jgi:hypothetical protein
MTRVYVILAIAGWAWTLLFVGFLMWKCRGAQMDQTAEPYDH